jgi:hypothetical protein
VCSSVCFVFVQVRGVSFEIDCLMFPVQSPLDGPPQIMSSAGSGTDQLAVKSLGVYPGFPCDSQYRTSNNR